MYRLNSYFQYLEDEIKINIFKHADHPFNLARSCKSWAAVAKDSYAKTEWLLARSGKTHALFVAVKLGPSFLTIPVCQNLLTRKVIISRYFVQRLLMHFGKYDQKLIDLKIEHNVNQLEADRICAFQQKIKSPWASNLSLPVFLYLLNEGCNQLGNAVPLKGNDMELFHFLSAGPHVINFAPGMLRKNLKDIEDLILNQKFIPFPPRPKSIQQPLPEEYPPKDGYENRRQLTVIARTILIHPDLVNLWKQIGYEEICEDLNDLVLRGALLILFPSAPSSDWVCPTVSNVISRLNDLISLGFILKDSVIIDALHMFEHRLDEIGNILWSVFCTIRFSETIDSLALNFFREALKPERNLKKDYLINFLKSKFDHHEQVIKVVAHYFKN
ncbi:5982_t:CDS:1 [Funneliformis mosseae]|uniref:5982_t:CDS:1 n=1 Tax=Funneliformis mosseae TaxID=27381 RepID=A0A9N9CH35_FUNMO|nr:5982_t:CDS:1 [Funneliformis mosseae]